jgi:hypothetical protein
MQSVYDRILWPICIRRIKNYPWPWANVLPMHLGRKGMGTLSANLTKPCFIWSFRRILMYLIPIKMLKGVLPPCRILEKYKLGHFSQIRASLRRGDLRLFSESLETHEKIFLSRFIYLPIERLRYIVYRRLFKIT